jgi:hypothetical protein
MYFSWTISLLEADIPGEWAAADAVLPEAIDLPGALMTASRGDWLHFALRNIFAESGGSALIFLVKDPESRPEDRLRLEGKWSMTSLPHAGITGALTEIDSLLVTAANNPERFEAPMANFHAACIAEDARDALDLTKDGVQEMGLAEDGDRPIYFFSFLKGLRTVLLDAQARRMAVLHLRYVYD